MFKDINTLTKDKSTKLGYVVFNSIYERGCAF